MVGICQKSAGGIVIIKLDKRLTAVAHMVKEGSTLVDIGSDHAYLPIYLCQKGVIQRAAATDVHKGPVKNAEDNIASEGLSDKITARLADGMDGLDLENYDTVTVCGMGGELIFRIINNEKVKTLRPNLILQPMSSIDDLSFLLAGEGFEIYDDTLVRDGGRIYRIMMIKYTGNPYKISYLEAHAGRINLQKRSGEVLELVKRLKEKLNLRLLGKSASEQTDTTYETELLNEIEKYLSGAENEL